MNNAQSSLEYLLLIGGVVIVAAIVISLIVSVALSEEQLKINFSKNISDSISQEVKFESSFGEEWETYYYWLSEKKKPSGWILGDDWMFQPEKSNEQSPKSTDGYSLKFQDPSGMLWEWAAIYHKLPFDAEKLSGKTLMASFWVKGEPNNKSPDYLWGFCKGVIDKPCYGTVLVDLHNPSWKEYNVKAKIPSDATGEIYLTFSVRPGCSLPVVCMPNKEPTNVWVDDVKIELLD